MQFILGFFLGFTACAGAFFVSARLYSFTRRTEGTQSAIPSLIFGKEKGAILEEKPDLAKEFFNL